MKFTKRFLMLLISRTFVNLNRIKVIEKDMKIINNQKLQ